MKRTIAVFLPVLFVGFMLADTNNIGVHATQKQFDGPVVMYVKNNIYVNYVFEENGIYTLQRDSMSSSQKDDIKLKVATDQDNITFEVQLQKKLKNEKPDYSGVNKMFVVSDIEGEFSAFRKLLQNNAIIDDKFNWIFGDGHLVLTGDFFDRGTMVTETLWLIYSLEEKAKAAGGYVHFILGNHEIMNLNNDLRYVHSKYMMGASLMNETYLNLYGENSELGRWLRTKNITEKIGNILFMHAGISSLLNSIELTVSRMNKIARPFYSDTTYDYKNAEVELLFSDYGPFWYRGYYYGTERAGTSQIDSTLAFYKVKHIATGHTVIADTISVLHGGKLFNTDVHHVKGHSEGLFIENGKFFRATSSGKKFLIYE